MLSAKADYVTVESCKDVHKVDPPARAGTRGARCAAHLCGASPRAAAAPTSAARPPRSSTLLPGGGAPVPDAPRSSALPQAPPRAVLHLLLHGLLHRPYNTQHTH